MKISVITVCKNAASTIGWTLESFFAQDLKDKELVIVDGASSDDTLKVIGRFPSEGVRVISEPDSGMYEAANKGLAIYTGDAVGMLNADDRFSDGGALSAIAEALADADIAFGNLDFVIDHEAGRVIRCWRGSPYRQGAVRRGWMPAHPTFYMRRGVAESTGVFDTRFQIAADYDFMLRALEIGRFRSGFVDRVLVNMKHGGQSTSGIHGRLRHNLEALRSRQEWLGAGVADFALFAKPLSKLVQLAIAPRALR